MIALSLKCRKNKMSYVQISYCTQSTEFFVLMDSQKLFVYFTDVL